MVANQTDPQSPTSPQTSSNNQTSNKTETPTNAETSTGPQYNATTTTVAMQTAAGVGAVAGLANSLIGGSSAQGAWVIVNMLQAILLLPLIAWYISDTVKNFIICNGFFTFSFGFIVLDHKDKIPFVNDLDFQQSNSYLKELGMQSGSSFVNNMMVIAVLILLILPHLILC